MNEEKRSASHWEVLRDWVRAVAEASPRRTVLGALVLLGSSLTEGVGVLLLVPLLAMVGVEARTGSAGRIGTIVRDLFATVGLHPTLLSVLVVYVGIAALQSFLQRLQMTLNLAVQNDFTNRLRLRLYRAIGGSTWDFLARSRLSDGVHVLTEQVDRAGSAAFHLIGLAVSIAVSLVFVSLAIAVSPAMTGVVLLCSAALAWTLRGQMSAARASGQALSAATQQLYAAVTEHLASIKTTKSYGAIERHTEILARLSREQRDAQQRMVAQYAALRQRTALGVPIVLAIVVYVSYGLLSVPTASLLLLLFLFARLMPRLTGLYETAQVLTANIPVFAAIADFERRHLAAREPVIAQVPLGLHDHVCLDDVTFFYAGGETPAVSDVSLTIRAGTTTAIVGPSGSGKSTLADLLMGLLTPRNGRILIDGRVFGPEHLSSWRDQIGYVAQDAFLFHDTVRANLLWARPDASDEEVWRALRLAAAEPFVAGLPRGLDTILGDRGVLVSGGERQRLSLARALLRRPNLLILDEATSSLDSENELRIQQAIDGLHEQMTIVIITHRLSTIRHADSIHVIDQGCLVESGTWNELIVKPHGRFRELCAAQGIDGPPASTLEVPKTRSTEPFGDAPGVRGRKRADVVH